MVLCLGCNHPSHDLPREKRFCSFGSITKPHRRRASPNTYAEGLETISCEVDGLSLFWPPRGTDCSSQCLSTASPADSGFCTAAPGLSPTWHYDASPADSGFCTAAPGLSFCVDATWSVIQTVTVCRPEPCPWAPPHTSRVLGCFLFDACCRLCQGNLMCDARETPRIVRFTLIAARVSFWPRLALNALPRVACFGDPFVATLFLFLVLALNPGCAQSAHHTTSGLLVWCVPRPVQTGPARAVKGLVGELPLFGKRSSRAVWESYCKKCKCACCRRQRQGAAYNIDVQLLQYACISMCPFALGREGGGVSS